MLSGIKAGRDGNRVGPSSRVRSSGRNVPRTLLRSGDDGLLCMLDGVLLPSPPSEDVDDVLLPRSMAELSDERELLPLLALKRLRL